MMELIPLGCLELLVLTFTVSNEKQPFAYVLQNSVLKILQYSQENTSVGVFKKRLQHRGFPVNIAEFFKTAFL